MSLWKLTCSKGMFVCHYAHKPVIHFADCAITHYSLVTPIKYKLFWCEGCSQGVLSITRSLRVLMSSFWCMWAGYMRHITPCVHIVGCNVFFFLLCSHVSIAVFLIVVWKTCRVSWYTWNKIEIWLLVEIVSVPQIKERGGAEAPLLVLVLLDILSLHCV